MIDWFKNNRDAIVRNSFLLPILLVVIMSISHVVSWYDLGNPYSWAIYLSVAIEIFALASVSASSIKMSRGSIWFLFGLVTLIQVIGNIFFEYRDINVLDEGFVSWVELISPAFEDFTITDHRRLLAAFQGGTLPLMSLTALHFYIKFNDLKDGNDDNNGDDPDGPSDDDIIKKGRELEMKNIMAQAVKMGEKREAEQRAEMGDEEYDKMIEDEPTALAFTKFEEDIDGRSVAEITKELAATEEAKRINDNAEAALEKAAEEGRIKMSKPSDLLAKGTDKQVKDIRSSTPLTLNKEIDPRTGKYKIM
jgi:hypothetical protein